MPAELAFAFERLGGTLSCSGGLRLARVQHDGALAAISDAAAALLDLVFSEPRLAEADVSTERALMITEAEQVADDMFRYPFQLAFAGGFGDAGYGLPVTGCPRHSGHHLPGRRAVLARAAMLGGRPSRGGRGRRRCRKRPARCWRVCSATVSQGRGRDPCAASLGWWAGQMRRCGSSRGESSRLRWPWLFPGRAGAIPIGRRLEVWAAVASGLGGRMFEALRDRRSLAYTVMASSWQTGTGGRTAHVHRHLPGAGGGGSCGHARGAGPVHSRAGQRSGAGASDELSSLVRPKSAGRAALAWPGRYWMRG